MKDHNEDYHEDNYIDNADIVICMYLNVGRHDGVLQTRGCTCVPYTMYRIKCQPYTES
jgi:hypothetical protein